MSMRVPTAVYRRRGVVEVEERELPEPAADEVVVEVAYCGVCGSDLHLIVEGWGRPGDVLGHEWSGTVVQAGSAVTAFAPGQAVLKVAEPRCGACEACRAGRPSQCSNQAAMTGSFDGAFATRVLSRADTLLAVPDGLPLRTAALAEPLAVALHAVTRAELSPDASVLVSGAGPIGALVAAVLVERGHAVDVVEPHPTRQALASELGVREVRHPDELATFDMSQVDTLAEPAYHAVIETSGRRTAMEAGAQQLRRGGRLVLVGTGLDQPRFDSNRMIVMELTVTGAFVYDDDGFERSVELLSSGRLPTDVLIDQAEYDLHGVAAAAENLAAGVHAGKVMIVPSRTAAVDPTP